MSKRVLIINGPNLNMLGTREPEIYGSDTLDDINALCKVEGTKHGFEIECFQSNIEGELVSKIQSAKNSADAIIINAGAYTHTSVAIHDALKLLSVPIIEVHLSNPMARESFRHQSFITPIAKGVIAGFGAKSYLLAIQSLI
jgi:3-dehydroquinate dehydratase-2